MSLRSSAFTASLARSWFASRPSPFVTEQHSVPHHRNVAHSERLADLGWAGFGTRPALSRGSRKRTLRPGRHFLTGSILALGLSRLPERLVGMPTLLWALLLGLALGGPPLKSLAAGLVGSSTPSPGGQFDPNGDATPNAGSRFDPDGLAVPSAGNQFDPNGGASPDAGSRFDPNG